jgi:CRP/FNR family cyclic AMP-dependent transcriptional regulator
MDSTLQLGCNECDHRTGGPFCLETEDASRGLDEIKEQQVLPTGARLFDEGASSRGVYLLCEGKAQLSICSENGRQLILRTAAKGEMLALGACLSGQAYQYTAELLEPSQVVFIKRKELLKFLREHPAICLEVVRHLSDDLHQAYERVRAVGLNRSRGMRVQRARSSEAC